MINYLSDKEKLPGRIFLIVILIIATLLRFKSIALQSFWLDELHTMNEADPSLPWSDLFQALKLSDQHPPLFFIMERISMSVIGFNEWGARTVPAIAGVFSVFAAYLLGRESLNRKTGIIAAAITCVNYYNIYYSQEARDYIFLWLFTTLSYTYFIRLCKTLNKKDAVWYIINTVLLLYSHYFSLMVLFAQFLLFVVLWFSEKEDKKKFFLTFTASALFIVLCYLPWVPYLAEMGKITSFWIQMVSEDFYFQYFNEYFGHAALAYIFLYIFLISYIVNVIQEYTPKANNTKNNPVVLSFILISISVIAGYMVPYIRSVLVVPMLISRYTIIVIPSIILAIALGVALIRADVVRYILFGSFIFVSLFDLIFVRDYYTRHTKHQFREITKLITDQPTHHPVINQLTAWHQGYYLKRFNYRGTVLSGDKNNIVDSIIVKASTGYDIDTFWVVGLHGDPHLNDVSKAKLDSAFVLLGHQDFVAGWAQWYARKK